MLALMRLSSRPAMRPLFAQRLSSSSRAALIKELRARTSAPMKKCADALSEAGGDVEEAATLLRKAGLAAAQKKASRGASDGVAAVAHGPAGLAVVELNSETDFVARNELFQALAGGIARTALSVAGAVAQPITELEPTAVRSAKLDGDSSTVEEAIGFAVSQLGENLVLRRACLLAAPAEGGTVASYVHNTYAPGVGRTAAAVVLRSSAADVDAVRALGEQIAMHIVASSPLYLERSAVPEAAVEHERSILSEQARASGKKQDVIDKMVEGRLRKYFAEVCLLEQPYVVEESAGTVSKVSMPISHVHACTQGCAANVSRMHSCTRRCTADVSHMQHACVCVHTRLRGGRARGCSGPPPPTACRARTLARACQAACMRDRNAPQPAPAPAPVPVPVLAGPRESESRSGC